MNKEKHLKQNKKMFYPGFDEPKEFYVSAQPKSTVFRIEIDSVIEEVSQFSMAIRMLGMAKEEDVIEIHLQCPGGSVDASGALVHAMNKCEAHIHVIATGGVHSAATHILLEADSFELSDNFNCLLHNGASGSVGNINEYVAKAKFDAEFLHKQYWAIYEGFLSTEEFAGLMRGDNMWLGAQEFCARYKKRYEYFKEKAETMEKEAARLEAAIQALEQEPPATLKPTRKKKVAKAA